MKSGGEKPVETIKIGIYGHTGAGKTRFLFELLDGWDRSGKILRRSNNCKRFLSKVRKQLEVDDRTKTTPHRVDDISVQLVLHDGKEPTELVFGDFRGEMLAAELDKETFDPSDAIPSQVQQCDVFLFFFDPAPSQWKQCKDRLDRHHADELQRAEKFLEYVLATRQNEYLPVVFVQTHLDFWQSEPEITEKAHKWQGQVNALAKRLYREHLMNHFPETFCDPEKTQHAISSIRSREVERPIESAVDLVRAARSFSARDRKKVRRRVVFSSFVVLVFLVLLVLSVVFTGRNPGQGPVTSKTFPENEPEARALLDEWEKVFKAHPPGRQLPRREDAEKVNKHLHWLTYVMDQISDNSSIRAQWAEETRKRIQSAWSGAVALVREKLNIDTSASPDQLRVLAAYLKEIPAEPVTKQIGALQDRFWQLARRCATERIAEVLERRRSVGSAPMDTLVEILDTLRKLRDESEQYQVGLVEKGHEIISELRTAITLCEVIADKRTYSADFRVTKASLDPNKEQIEVWRVIRVLSPGQHPRTISLEPHKNGEQGWELKSDEPSYEIDLGLGKPLECQLWLYDSAKQRWTILHGFDILKDLQGLSLADLGLNLVLRHQAEVHRAFSRDGYNIEVKFAPRLRIPSLLWEAVELSMEQKKP